MGGWGADAHHQGGPGGRGGPQGGRAVGQCHLDVQPIDATALDTQLPVVQLRSVQEGAAQGRASQPVQPAVLPRSWRQSVREEGRRRFRETARAQMSKIPV